LIIPPNILPAKVSQKPSSLPHEFEQATLGMIVVAVGCHMRCQLFYSLRKQRYLYLGGTGITLTSLVGTDDFGLFLFIQVITLPVYVIKIAIKSIAQQET
jgi:hypothetical protein